MDKMSAIPVKVQLDVQEIDRGISAISNLADTVREIGDRFSVMFDHATRGIDELVISAGELTDGIIEASAAMQLLTDAIYSQASTSNFFDIISTSISALSLACDLEGSKLMGKIGGLFSGMKAGMSASGGGALVGFFKPLKDAVLNAGGWIKALFASPKTWIVVLIAAIVAAIVALVVLIIKNWDEIKAFFAKEGERFNTNVIQPVAKFFRELWAGIVSTARQAWDGIVAVFSSFGSWVNTNVIQPVVGFFVGLWTSIVNIVTQIWNGIVAVFSGIALWVDTNVIQPMISFFTPLVEWFAALFGSIWQTISDVFYNIGVIVSGCWLIIQTAWAMAAEWFNTNVIQPVVGFFASLWTGIVSLATSALLGIQMLWVTIVEWISVSIIQPVIGFFTSMWSGIVGLATAAVLGIQAVLATISTWINEVIIQPVTTFFANMWEGFKSGAVAAWEAVKSVFSTVANFFGNIFSEAWQKVVSVFSVAGSIFVDIRDGILTAFKSIVNGIIRGLNQVVSIPFNGINAALDVIRGIKILDAQPFANLIRITVPQIPLLAQGAVLPANRPFLAVVGDQKSGTNVEAPLATIQEALASVLAQQGTGDIRITFTGDLAQLARVLKPAIEREERRVGGSLARGVAV